VERGNVLTIKTISSPWQTAVYAVATLATKTVMATVLTLMSEEEPIVVSDATLAHYIEILNKWIGAAELPWFVCEGCNKLTRGSGTNLSTSKWGDERDFCLGCIYYCRGCEETYALSMKYRHEDCEEDASSSSSGASDD
jgi:hypothetical protein